MSIMIDAGRGGSEIPSGRYLLHVLPEGGYSLYGVEPNGRVGGYPDVTMQPELFDRLQEIHEQEMDEYDEDDES